MSWTSILKARERERKRKDNTTLLIFLSYLLAKLVAIPRPTPMYLRSFALRSATAPAYGTSNR